MLFDIFPNILSSLASFLFPLYASYKALKTSDPAQLTPWLMYWVVLACVFLVESWTGWFLFWIPFYAHIRLFCLLYLVLPQTQGAKVIYTTYIHPWLEENENAIEDFIASAHERSKQAGVAYVKQVIKLITDILGMSPPSAAADSSAGYTGYGAGAGSGTQQPQSYTQSLLARFTLPAGRWSGSTGEAGAATGADFYSFLSSAVSAAANAAAASSSRSTTSVPREGETLIPANIRGTSARMSFIAAQRERLSYVLSALDREASQLQTQSETEAATASHLGPQQGGGIKMRSLSGQSIASAATSGTSLSKSRSEGDFEKLDAESGAEDDNGSGLRRRTPGVGQEGASAGGGSWMPWGWGSGANTSGNNGNGADRSTPTPGSE
ncbi:receptor expression-enhancing protein 2 [Rhypophila decipiens]